jgi:mevalonate kinase
VIGVIAYMALYNGGGGYGGSGSGGSGSGGGGGYILLAFSADQARRLKERISAKRR